MAMAMFTAGKADAFQGRASETRLAGRVIIGDVKGARGTTAIDVDGIKLGRRGVTFPFPWALDVGRFAWVEVKLASGKTIKPLVAVLGSADGQVSARIVHCFPEHLRALEAQLASATGY
ncbi:MAG: hypothetical protein U1F43_17360 [Myxococcota bacterium]